MLSSRAKRASDGKEDGKLSLSASVMSDVDTRGFARRSVSEMAILSGFMKAEAFEAVTSAKGLDVSTTFTAFD